MAGVLWWSAILIGLLLVAFVLVSAIKKRLVKPHDTMSAGFTLSDLRALHRQGKMSDQEFAKAKEAVVAAARRAQEQKVAQSSAFPGEPMPPRAGKARRPGDDAS